MPLGMLLPRHLVRESLAKFLLIEDLSHFQALDSHTHGALEDALAWWESARAALPNFNISRELLQKESRGQFLTLFKTFLKASAAVGLEVPLRNMDEARKLSKLLGNANKAVANHLARGGGFAQVVVGRLKFQKETIGAAFEEVMSQDASSPGDPELCLGSSITVPDAPRKAGAEKLRLHFAWQGGSLLVSARDDGLPTSRIDLPRDYYSMYQGMIDDPASGQRPLTLDVMSMSNSLMLNHRGVAVPTNAAWQAAASGIFALTKGKAAAKQALTEGILCVVCVRDGMPEHTTYLAKTLHLDTPQR